MARKKSRRLFFSITLALILGAAAMEGFSVMSRPEGEIDGSRLGTVERGDLARSVVATGRIEPVAKVEIKSKANGIIKALHVDVGHIVTQGQVLAELDKENLAARLRETRAALMSAQANLKAAEAQLQKNTIEAEGPDVPFAKRNFERAERLSREGLLPQQALDDTRSALEQALNRQNVARSQLSVSQARIAQAHAEVSQADAAVERAQEELNYATIRSPIDGMVLSRDVEIGSPVSSILNMGSAATLVMVLGDIRQVYVRGKVDEADIGVMNIMLISVRERTREIGIRKALGATRRKIQWQFLSEGLFLTLISGAIGFAIGYSLCALVNQLPLPERFSGMILTWQTGLFSVVALVVVGVAAACYPARRAAALTPIEALRYEL